MDATGFQTLLNKARSGDESATGELLLLVRGHLAQSAGRYQQQTQAVESTSDLVQEASLRLWQHLPEFRGGSTDDESLAMFLAWSEQIVNRLGLNALRDRAAQCRFPRGTIHRLGPGAGSSRPSPGEPVAADPSPSASARSREEAACIQDAVARLTDEVDRELLRLRFFEGRSLRQIADDLRLSYDQIRDRFKRIMRRLERDLEGLL
jgi:RNA polymerase sigma factor (sigma-70 family)